jgi:hypothetical protein
MPASANSTRIYVILAAIVAVSLAACGGNPDAVKEKRSGASGDRNSRDMVGGLGGSKQETGSLFGPGGLFGSKPKEKDDYGSGVAVNAYLWRASLDTINFIPLVSADPFGGVIITDWYTPPQSPNERFKINVFILGRTLWADGVRAAVFRQQMASNGWIDAPVAGTTATDLENAILVRARQLRIAQTGS